MYILECSRETQVAFASNVYKKTGSTANNVMVLAYSFGRSTALVLGDYAQITSTKAFSIRLITQIPPDAKTIVKQYAAR